MSDEKKLILKMLKEGKITEDEAIKLLESMGQNKKEKENPFSQIDVNIIERIAQAANIVSKKSQEFINNIDFDNLNIGFDFKTGTRSTTERICTENLLGVENPDLSIENLNGHITLYSWENEEIEARANINYDDKAVSGNYNFLSLYKEDNKIFVKPNYENSSARHFDMDMTIAIPQKLFNEISITSTNASIKIDDITCNKLDLNSTNAKISVKNIKATDSKINSTNAKIEIENVLGDSIEISTTNGKIQTKALGIRAINLSTTNGSLTIGGIRDEVELINATTTHGNISISLDNVFRPIKATVHNHFKDIGASNFSENLFTNFVSSQGSMIAYTDNYDENKDSLNINASTHIGAINIK